MILEVEEPSETLMGTFSLERRKGDNHVFKEFIRRLKQQVKSGNE